MITSVEPFILHVPVTGSHIADSTHAISHWGVVGAKISGDDGIVGYGFTGTHAHLPGDRLVAQAIAECYAPLLVGSGGPAEYADDWPPAVYERLFTHPPLQWVGRAGILQLALSAVDIALWDLYAKRRGLPLHRLLGGPVRERVQGYNTDIGWLSFSREQLVANVRTAVTDGFTAVKIKVGAPSMEEDIRRLQAVRDAVGPDVVVATDANGRWDLPTAQRFARRVAPLDILWIEEPLWHDDVEAHAELAATSELPIALGEQIYTSRDMAQFIQRRAVHYVQPDVTRIGGITGFLQAAEHARAVGLPVAGHAGEMSQVHVHLAYALPHHTILEYIPWIAHAFEEAAVVRDGAFTVPRLPGAGTTPTATAMDRFRVH
jgi:L-alanine-DL-glutamate epimerase-like enolase superfamily enzyme